MSGTESPVPDSKDDLTREWLQMALAASFPSASFLSLQCDRIGEAFGFASEVYRCQWQEETSQQSVVVKLWSTDSKAGIQEVLFYSSFKDIGIRIPRYHFSAMDKENNKAVLVLEDLIDSVHGADVVPLDLTRAKNVARMLAKLHGKWVNNTELSNFSWLSDASLWNQTQDWLNSRKTECVERYDEHLTGFARKLLGKIELAPKVANERLACAPTTLFHDDFHAPTTLFHDDFHLDNILFENEYEPVLLDWTSPVLGPSAYNLVDLLLFLTPLEHFDSVFQCYLDEFNQVSTAPQHKEDLKHQMGGALLQRFSRSTCGVARWQPPSERGIQLVKEGIALSCNVSGMNVILNCFHLLAERIHPVK